MFQDFGPRPVSSGLIVSVLLIILANTGALADPPTLPMPEDVLRPYGGDAPAFYLIPYLGINSSFLLSESIRQRNEESLGEITNDVINRGGGIGFEVGIDALYRFSDLVGLRGGLGYARRVIGSSGQTVALCRLEVPGSGSFVESEEAVDMSWCVVADYLDLHLAGELHFGDAFVSLGYGFGLPVRVTYDESDEIVDTTNACVYFPLTEEATKRVSGRVELDDAITEIRHSIRLGGGYAWELSDRLDALLRFEYDHPLTPVSSGGDPAGLLVNPEIDGNLRYRVPLNDEVRLGTFSLVGGLRIRI